LDYLLRSAFVSKAEIETDGIYVLLVITQKGRSSGGRVTLTLG